MRRQSLWNLCPSNSPANDGFVRTCIEEQSGTWFGPIVARWCADCTWLGLLSDYDPLNVFHKGCCFAGNSPWDGKGTPGNHRAIILR